MSLINDSLIECKICPNMCGTNRLEGEMGACNSALLPKLARADLHYWEEPCISGTKGSGAIFFTNCNLSCVFCQNYKISHEGFGKEVSIEKLSDIYLDLKNKGALNINLVSATQYIPQVAESLSLAKKNGLNIPIVFNSNGYETIDGLKLLDGLVDVYLPDLKYYDSNISMRYSKAPDYFKFASLAILEMYRQVGVPVYKDGLIKSGIMIRHLLLPGHSEDSKNVLRWIKDNLPLDIPISLMSQYTPVYKAQYIHNMNRKISKKEYDEIINYFFEIELKNGFVQEQDSASSDYTPSFDLTGI